MPFLDWIRSHLVDRQEDDARVRDAESLTKLKRDLTEYTKRVQQGEMSDEKVRVEISRNVLEDALLHDQIERFFASCPDDREEG